MKIKSAKLDPNVDNNSNSFCMKTGCMLKWLACLISCTWLKNKIVLQYKCFFFFYLLSECLIFKNILLSNVIYHINISTI